MPSYATLTYDQLWTIIFQNPLSGAEADYVVDKVRSARDSFGFGKPDLDEPLTYDKIRAYVAAKRGSFNDKATIAGIYRDGLTSGSLPSLAGDADKAVANALLPGGWVERLIRAALDTFTSPETWKAISEINITNWTNWDASDYDRAKKAFLGFVKDPGGPIQQFIDANAFLIPYLVTFMTGLSVNSDVVKGMLDGSIDANDRQEMGKVVYSLLDTNLLQDKVKQGFLDRLPGPGEVDNMQRLFGALLRLEIGGVALEAVEPLIPKQVAKFLKSLREAMENALNLDDAAEEIFQVPIDMLVSKGLEAQYNRTFLPADFSDNQAIQAHIGYDLPRETLDKIFDNNGLRKDIRDTLISMTAANLTESDINEAYQRNLLSIEQVKEQYKQKYFQEPERQIKTDLVKGTRRWQLQTKVVELLGNLYRDGVQTKDTCVPYLNALGFENDEQDLWFMQQELERKQRKWLSNAQIEDMLKHGLANVEWAIDYQVMQGMLPEDATLVYMGYLLDKYNKQLDEDCVQILKDAASPAKLIGFLLGKLPEFGIAGMFGKAELQKVLQCLLTNTKKAP